MNTIFIVLPILTLLMFDIGLTLRPADFRIVIQRPRPVVAGLVGQIVLLPLIAWCIVLTFHLPPLFSIGIMLIACSPGGSSSNVFSMLAGGDVALSVSLTAMSSIITLFTGPLIMALVSSILGSAIDLHLPIGNLLVQNIVLMAVPIAVGMWLTHRFTSIATRLHGILRRLAFPCLILLATVFFIQHRATIVSEFPNLGLTTTVLIITALLCGTLLAFILKLNGRERRTIVIEVGMQNAAQAITVACSPLVLNNETIAIPAIVYALMMNVILLSYVAIYRFAQRKR
ncbi:MAG: bile acid:sodium symporter family protein [Bacteroidaceae bacterium]|nr:bile acid:sodium symporter family protein [Bacteroidaceae bacterium]MBR1379688.1 bile acid:sodium symporter family protein [Bacteroidaceae bacterium]